VWGDAGNDVISIRFSKEKGSYVDCGPGRDVLFDKKHIRHRSCELNELPKGTRHLVAPW
jgi:hypothetical protein